MEWQELTSLVGSIRTRSLVARPRTIEQCREVLAYCRQVGITICARGAGRGYGDLALNDGHALLDMSAMNRILDFDEDSRQITVEAGARIIDIYQAVHHLLLTLPSSPTESHSSVAGAICANVNGKDAWRHGSFAHQVVRLTLLLASGEALTVDRSHELFNAVVGGIGLGSALPLSYALGRGRSGAADEGLYISMAGTATIQPNTGLRDGIGAMTGSQLRCLPSSASSSDSSRLSSTSPSTPGTPASDSILTLPTARSAWANTGDALVNCSSSETSRS